MTMLSYFGIVVLNIWIYICQVFNWGGQVDCILFYINTESSVFCCSISRLAWTRDSIESFHNVPRYHYSIIYIIMLLSTEGVYIHLPATENTHKRLTFQ